MKKLLLMMAFFSFSVSASAGVFLDVNFTPYLSAGDAETQLGGGAALSVNFHPQFAFKYKGAMTFYTEDSGLDTQVDYEHMMHGLGVEYMFTLKNFRTVIRPSIIAGISSTVIEQKENFPGTDMSEKRDLGFSAAFYLGVDFHATQYIAPFFELGYHKSFYEQELLKSDISGFVLNLGVRIAFSGNSYIYDGY